MTDFTTLGVDNKLVQALRKMGITTPTPIQEQSIPKALEGADLLASAQTGTGKTVAYLMPLLTNLLNNPLSTALVLTPTRELAVQVRNTVLELFNRNVPFGTALLIGGDSMFVQLKALRQQPRLIVGTPGRINDHLNRKTLDLRHTRFLVLDETDRMLDMDFSEELEKIAKFIPEDRQTLMFSATIPPSIVRISAQYLKNPARVSIAPSEIAAPKIKQSMIQTSQSEKFGHLLRELDERQESIIIFVKTKDGARLLVDKLAERDHSVDTIHGDLRQSNRERVIRSFRNKKYRILIATDVAARGLDIPHIRHVINYDLPQCSEDYIHRIGRTGRAGAEGEALSLVAPDDIRKWKAIQRLMDPTAKYQEEPRRASSSKGKKPFGKKPFGKPFGKKSSEGSDRKPFSSDRPAKKTYAADPSDFGDRPARRNFSEGKSERKPFSSDRPAKKSQAADFGDRSARRDFSEGKSERKPFSSDRPAKKSQATDFGDRSTRRDFSEGKSEKKPFSGKPSSKPFSFNKKKSGAANSGNRSFSKKPTKRAS